MFVDDKTFGKVFVQIHFKKDGDSTPQHCSMEQSSDTQNNSDLARKFSVLMLLSWAAQSLI